MAEISKHIEYYDGYHWILAKETTYQTNILGFEVKTDYVSLSAKGVLVLQPRYASDGVTGITGTPWQNLLERKWLRRGAFGHDGLYQLIRLGLLPKEYRRDADDLMKMWCIEDGAWEWEAGIVWRFINKWGGEAINPKTERKLLIAP